MQNSSLLMQHPSCLIQELLRLKERRRNLVFNTQLLVINTQFLVFIQIHHFQYMKTWSCSGWKNEDENTNHIVQLWWWLLQVRVFHIMWPLCCHFFTQNRCILKYIGWKERPINVKLAVVVCLLRRALRRAVTKFIIFNTEFIIFNTEFIIFNKNLLELRRGERRLPAIWVFTKVPSFWFQNASFWLQNLSFWLQNPSFWFQNSSFWLQNSSFWLQNSSFLIQIHHFWVHSPDPSFVLQDRRPPQEPNCQLFYCQRFFDWKCRKE